MNGHLPCQAKEQAYLPLPDKGADVDATNIHILRESLDLIILKALTWGPRHGYAISEWIESATGDALFVDEGTLYPSRDATSSRPSGECRTTTGARNTTG